MLLIGTLLCQREKEEIGEIVDIEWLIAGFGFVQIMDKVSELGIDVHILANIIISGLDVTPVA